MSSISPDEFLTSREHSQFTKADGRELTLGFKQTDAREPI
jgi:hypothetical protein